MGQSPSLAQRAVHTGLARSKEMHAPYVPLHGVVVLHALAGALSMHEPLVGLHWSGRPGASSMHVALRPIAVQSTSDVQRTPHARSPLVPSERHRPPPHCASEWQRLQ